MNTLHDSLTEQLSAVLREYIAGGGEAPLLRSYDLGRSAVAHHMNVLELLAVQQEAFMSILLQRLGDEESTRLTRAAAEIFAESLAPFELAQRSSQEGNALLRLLNVELERQVAERTQELRHTVERLAALHSIDRAILAAESIDDIVRVVLSLLRALVFCERASVHVFAESGREVTLLAVDVEGEDATEIGTRSPIEFYGDVGGLNQAQVSVEENLTTHSRLPPYLQYLREQGVRSYARVPLGAQGNTIGFIYVARYNSGSFSPEHLAIAQEVADQTAIALQQEKLREQVQHHTISLQRQRDFAENLIQTAQVIVLVLDPEGRIVRFNPYMETLSGYRLAEVQGTSWEATFIPERLHNRAQTLFSEVIRGPQNYHATIPIVTRDGHEREIEWSSSLLKDPNGSTIGFLSIGQDITERERVETALRNLVETTQDAVITVDAQGRIELFNPAAERIFGYAGSEVLGQNVNVLMPEPYAAEHGEYMARAQRTGEHRAIGRTRTVAARRKNGEVFPIEISLAEIRTGDEVRYGAFIRDISEKVRLQERLLERERLAAIGTTAATFAHEVGNPLNSMYLSVQLLDRRLSKQRPEVDEKTRESLHSLTGEIKRLTSLLQEFRALARRPTLDFRPVSLTAVVADVLAVETLSYAPRGITVEQAFAPDLPSIWADAEKIKQMVLNLCKNASEAMAGGGTLTVSADICDGLVRLEVTDTGVGIPAGVDIFEPFLTTKAQGTGLGLTIVRQLVAAHNGTLTYRSVPGEGTTFTLILPAAPGTET